MALVILHFGLSEASRKIYLKRKSSTRERDLYQSQLQLDSILASRDFDQATLVGETNAHAGRPITPACQAVNATRIARATHIFLNAQTLINTTLHIFHLNCVRRTKYRRRQKFQTWHPQTFLKSSRALKA